MKPMSSVAASRSFHALRPYCMSVVAALEKALASEQQQQAGSGVASSANVAEMDGMAVRRLKDALSDLHAAVQNVVESPEMSAAEVHQAFAPLFPLLMFLLRLVLAPAKPNPESSADKKARGHAGVASVESTVAASRGGSMSSGVKEQALLCAAAVISGSGPRFVQDFGVRPTTNLLVMLVSILSECSLESAPGTSSSLDGDGSGSVQESGAISRATSSGGGGGSGSGGSGLSAGTDALRLACLGCLEALLQAPFDANQGGKISGRQTKSSSACGEGQPTSECTATSPRSVEDHGDFPAAWLDVRNFLQSFGKGGLMGQLVQALLVCCQVSGGRASGSRGPSAQSDNRVARAGRRVGIEESRLAARCLCSLSSFAPDVGIWRRFLPGTFSGLFRTIRVMGAPSPGGASPGSLQTPALTAIPFRSTLGITSGIVNPSRGGNSILIETCLAVLTKVLLLCASEGAAVAATEADRSLRSRRADTVSSSSSVDRGAADGAKSGEGGSGDPLLVLQRLALTSNSKASAASNSSGKSRPGVKPEEVSAVAKGLPGKDLGPSKSSFDAAATIGTGSRTEIIARQTKHTRTSWTKETSNRLRALLPSLLAFCRLHPGWRVRRGAAQFASSLLRPLSGGDWSWDRGKDRRQAGRRELDATERSSGLMSAEDDDQGQRGGLLGSLTPILVEALVGLVLDDMLQVSSTARTGLDAFRQALSPLRWLELRGLMLERFCEIAEGLPATARSADETEEAGRAFRPNGQDVSILALAPAGFVPGAGALFHKLRHSSVSQLGSRQLYTAHERSALVFDLVKQRLRANFDLLAGYLSFLGVDARVALDARLPTLLSCLCEALEFDEDFNVQVLEGSSDGRPGAAVVGRVNSNSADGMSAAEYPKYYRQLLAHARQDATLSSARRALRFIGANGDLTFLADEVLSSLENRYPRPFRRGQRGRAVLEASMSVAHTGRSLLTRGGDDDAGSAGNGRGGLGESNYRRQCLTWIKPRLPMAWMLNQALMGRGPERCSEKTVRQEDRRRPDLAQASSGEGGVQPGVSRSLAIAWVERLLSSQAFVLPVSAADAAAAGFTDNSETGEPFNSRDSRSLVSGSVKSAVAYTRSGEILGGGGGDGNDSSLFISNQVLDANATLVSLVMETLASLAEACGPRFGEAFLSRALYPLLEKVASPHRVVSQAALATLWRMRSACGNFTDMSQLLAANMDYVVDDVIRRVATSGASSKHRSRRATQENNGSAAIVIARGPSGKTGHGVGIPAVVEVVLRIGGSAMGPALVRDLAGVTLKEVDALAWDPMQSSRSLGVLRAIVSCVSVPSISGNASAFNTNPSENSRGSIEQGDPGNGRASNGKEADGDLGLAREHSAARCSGDGSGGGGVDKSERTTCSLSQRESALNKSPWFRQLFVEFATVSDVEKAGEGDEPYLQGMLEEFKAHRKAMMGFEDLEGNVDTGKGSEEDGKEAQEAQAEDSALPEPDEERRQIAESQEVKIISEVLSRSCHFLATPSLESQASALGCVRDCVLKLATAGVEPALLPHVHRAWQPLMRSFREFLLPSSLSNFALAGDGRSSSGVGDYGYGTRYESLSARRAVLLHALDTVDAMVSICGDFLSAKIPEELWPLLKVLLLQYTSSTVQQKDQLSRRASSSRRARLTPSKQSKFLGAGYPSSDSLFSGNDSGVAGVLLSPSQLVTSSESRLSSPSGVDSQMTSSMTERSVRGGAKAHGPAWDPREGSLDVKVVSRALRCLEGMCRSSDCELFMTPLAREVALITFPCLSSSGSDAVRSSTESLFKQLLYLDGDSVWLLLLQAFDAAGALSDLSCPPDSSALIRGNDPGRLATATRGANASASAEVMSESELFLPHPPVSIPALKRGRPCSLAERSSVFQGNVAKECVPAVKRLLTFLNSHEAPSERA